MPLRASMLSQPTLTPLAEMLGRVSSELQDLAAQVERLHPLVSAGDRQSSSEPQLVQALQSFDHIEQKLRCLAGFLADLGDAAPPGWQLDPEAALAAVNLSDLAARLAGRETLAQDDASFGDYELF